MTFLSNNNITAVNRSMNHNTNMQTTTFSNDMLYQSNSGPLIGSHYNMQVNQQNQQNNVGPNTYTMVFF
ncbi:unnamed protein product [Rhizophagus irregularis]|nr:unnamed protein product [Rhizophagus irregularis]